MPSPSTRRAFLARAALGGAGLVILKSGRSARAYQANEKLNVALVGVSGRGSWFVGAIPRIGENVAAMCDVNDRRAAEAFKRFPDVPKYRDFRKMLDEKEREIDAVVVATPDNTHAVITTAAIRRGKHVYCEKPLTHDVAEARAVREAAKKHGVATQMGNQGTATNAFRRAVELIQAGAIGEIRDVHVWKDSGGSGPRPLPEGSEPVPDYLDWDVWLGPAAGRPFHSQWLQWHGWRDFATGELGNWASHTANLAFMSLKIDSLWYADASASLRIRITPEVSGIVKEAFPNWEILTWDVPARGELPPVPIHWYNGSRAPRGRKLVEDLMGRRLDWGDAGEKKWKDHGGCLIVGMQGMIHATEHNSSFTLLPEAQFAGFEGPPETLPRSGSHEREWLAACRGGPAAMSNFNYSGPLAEFLLLGNVATQFEHPLEFDPVACQVTNSAEANQALRREYRKGWSL
jgi:hypothetical protein